MLLKPCCRDRSTEVAAAVASATSSLFRNHYSSHNTQPSPWSPNRCRCSQTQAMPWSSSSSPPHRTPKPPPSSSILCLEPVFRPLLPSSCRRASPCLLCTAAALPCHIQSS
ncbi:hypothetical protein M0R45_020477 [Rubus argutus]|uniref:Uncharacterized protein n=1 Tax=Rubus argutus TaxID=59490 RepID=A0AAW1XAM2_RUBAR